MSDRGPGPRPAADDVAQSPTGADRTTVVAGRSAGIAQTWPALAVELTAASWPPDDLRLARRAFQEAEVRFAAAVRGSGKPFVDHLIGTASATLLGGGDATTVAAALLHAAYDQGDFGDGRRSDHPAHRATIQRAVGVEAEDLVHAYHRLGWSREVAMEERVGVATADDRRRRVLLVRVANEVDDALDAGLVVSGKAAWPAYDGRIAEAVVALADAVAAPALAALARRVLLDPPPDVAPELRLGRGASAVRLPPTAAARLRVTAPARARRLLRAARRRAVTAGQRLLPPR